jgi:hypothetical protein
MKKILLNIKPIVFLVGFFLLLSIDIYAAGGPPTFPGGGGGPPGGCWPPSTCIPIDGGLSFLLVAGAAYGAKKIFDHSKKDAE